MTVPLLLIFATGLTVLKYKEGKCVGRADLAIQLITLEDNSFPCLFAISNTVPQVLWEHQRRWPLVS